MRTLTVLCLTLATQAGCGGAPVSPDELPAQGHLREAEKERSIARDHLDAYRPEAVQGAIVPVRETPNDVTFYPLVFYNPTEWHLGEAIGHSEHARQHERAARDLERFEAEECRGFPPETRVACPVLGSVRELRDLARGVRLTFTEGIQVEALAAHMRCHQAYARTRGFTGAGDCPLYMRGITILGIDAHAIEITAEDPAAAREIQRRARQEVIPGARPTTL